MTIWTEIYSYYGCCSLRAGISMRSGILLIVTTILIASNTTMLIQLLRLKQDENWTQIFHAFAENTTYTKETEFQPRILFYVIIVYFITWEVFKGMYVLSTIIVIVALFKEKAYFIKLYMFINMPSFFFDIIISVVLAACNNNYIFRLCAFAAIMSEFYNLLALNSEYKRLVGKLKTKLFNGNDDLIVHPNNVMDCPGVDCNATSQNNHPHCRTCNCFYTPVLQHLSAPDSSNIPASTPECEPSSDLNESVLPPDVKQLKKTVNFNEEVIIFDENQLMQRNDSVLEELSRPTSLPDSKPKKARFQDIDVIFDDDQYNVGISPIIEDRSEQEPCNSINNIENDIVLDENGLIQRHDSLLDQSKSIPSPPIESKDEKTNFENRAFDDCDNNFSPNIGFIADDQSNKAVKQMKVRAY